MSNNQFPAPHTESLQRRVKKLEEENETLKDEIQTLRNMVDLLDTCVNNIGDALYSHAHNTRYY